MSYERRNASKTSLETCVARILARPRESDRPWTFVLVTVGARVVYSACHIRQLPVFLLFSLLPPYYPLVSFFKLATVDHSPRTKYISVLQIAKLLLTNGSSSSLGNRETLASVSFQTQRTVDILSPLFPKLFLRKFAPYLYLTSSVYCTVASRHKTWKALHSYN